MMERVGLSDIEDKWIEEKTAEKTGKLSENFYKKAANYAAEVNRELEGSDGLRRDLLREELRHILEMVQEIYLLRILKMTDVLFEEESGYLLTKERQALDEIKDRLEDLREDILTPTMRGESELRPPQKISNVLVLILSEIPEPIIGADMHYYGPFDKGDAVNIPEKSAELLVKQGLAKRLQVRGPF